MANNTSSDETSREDEMIIRNKLFFEHVKRQQRICSIGQPRTPQIRVRYPVRSAVMIHSAPAASATVTSPLPSPVSCFQQRFSGIISPGIVSGIASPSVPSAQENADDSEQQQDLADKSTCEEEREELSVHEMLVNLMPEYSCIWKVYSTEYKDNDRKIRSWEEISKRLGDIDGKLA